MVVEIKDNEAKTRVSRGRTNPPVYRGDFLGNWSEKVMDGQIPEFLVIIFRETDAFKCLK